MKKSKTKFSNYPQYYNHIINQNSLHKYANSDNLEYLQDLIFWTAFYRWFAALFLPFIHYLWREITITANGIRLRIFLTKDLITKAGLQTVIDLINSKSTEEQSYILAHSLYEFLRVGFSFYLASFFKDSYVWLGYLTLGTIILTFIKGSDSFTVAFSNLKKTETFEGAVEECNSYKNNKPNHLIIPFDEGWV